MSAQTKRNIGQIGIPVLISVIGGVAVGVFTALTYVNSAVGPIQTQTQMNQAAIAALTVKTDDTNDKVNALYNYFVTKGLSTPNIKLTTSSFSGQ